MSGPGADGERSAVGSRPRRILLALAVLAAAAAGVLVAVRAVRHYTPPLHHVVGSEDYLPGRHALLFAPAGTTRRGVVVVLVPGGGWTSAYDQGMRPLADRLAGAGYLAATITYRTSATGSYFPAPAQDVACAVDFAAARARERGVAHPRVVLAGHSAGAQLAAVVALRPGRFGGSCPYPPARPSALIGMSGVYDLRSAEQLAFPLFDATPAAAPQRWQLADPIRAARGALRPRPLPVLLLHGLADDDVPPAGTRRFAAALRDAGHPATVRLLPGITHGTVYTAGVAGPPILRWLAAGR